MPEYVTAPVPTDILPRRIVFCEDPFVLAAALTPWARQNPRFTFTCALTVSGLRTLEFLRKSLVRKVRRALSYMGCERDGVADDGISSIWRFPDIVQLSASDELRIGRSGFTFDANEPAPQPLQVEVCRAWIREHGRPTRSIRRAASTERLARWVTDWTRATGAFTDREQQDEFTGDRFRDDHVYVSEGAVLAAALAEGYQAQRIRLTGNAWLNLSHRESGKSWRGRVPLAPAATPAPISAAATARQKAIAFTERVKRRAAKERDVPRFRLAEAAKAIGVPVGRGRAPKSLTSILRELGWAPRYLMVRGRRSQWWCLASLRRA